MLLTLCALGNVYDVTSFAMAHPGGEQILLVALRPCLFHTPQ